MSDLVIKNVDDSNARDFGRVIYDGWGETYRDGGVTAAQIEQEI